eukprot:Phypoly_transcript_02389.p1 GENE.Phypoly_transcript_02389~~Phypoly_transcript_02389.p1  ORF type:complete len:939 (-),score=111.94 Phypoly_transcript_02389:24-2525(-)
MTTWYSVIPLASVKFTDNLKRETVIRKGGTFVEVPCWWDGTKESLQASISFARPDIQFSNNCPIPLTPPLSLFVPGTVPGVGELMLASNPPQIKSILASQNRWWMGEKYDGVRTCWNAENGKLYSKSGRLILLPPSLEAGLKSVKVILDCELWFGKGSFTEAQKVMSCDAADWPSMRLIAFDNPDTKISTMKFEDRYKTLMDRVFEEHEFIIISSRVKYVNKLQINRWLKCTLQDGGEGIILRKAESMYEHGRTESLLKLKATRGEMEALVVEATENGTFTLQLPNGLIFQTSQQYVALFEKIPKRGDVVTFTCENFSPRSIPVNAEIFRIRHDVSWLDVVRDYLAEKAREQTLNDNSGVLDPNKPSGFWKSDKMRNLRLFFEKLASENKLDHLNPNTWYNLSSAYLKRKGISHVVNKFKGGYPKLIMHLFPDIGLQEARFSAVSNFWTDIKNQRNFFVSFAKSQGFDPFIARNWYSVSSEAVKSHENAKPVLSLHGQSHVNALLHVFPEIGLKTNLFKTKPRGFWGEAENQRNFFISFAQKIGFDPLVADNWYNVATEDLKSEQGASSLLNTFSGSFRKAILHVFPNIGLQEHLFKKPSYENLDGRNLLLEFACERKFDALIPENWYSIRTAEIHTKKGGSQILSRYGGSIRDALPKIFTEISFDIAKFKSDSFESRIQWNDKNCTRRFLVAFAKDRKFDPLVAENWYSVSARQLRSFKGGDSYLAHCATEGGYVDGIVRAFPNIVFQKDKFPKNHKFWADETNQRAVFFNFAKSRKFDSRDPISWHAQLPDFVKTQKKSGSILNYYDNNAAKALLHLFPDIGLDKKKLRLG